MEVEDHSYTEAIQEQTNKQAHEILHASAVREKWVTYVALSTALIAVLAAITGLLAGNHSDAEMLAQMHSSDEWAFYEAKGIKADLLASSDRLSVIMGEGSDASTITTVTRLQKQQNEGMKKALEFEKQSDMHAQRHDVLAKGVTLFQVAIAIGAIAIIVKRKALWFMSLLFGSTGLYFLIEELLL